MADVKIYTTALCPYCYRAKGLLEAKGIDFTEIDVTFSPSLRREMVDLAGGRTSVPQIWINGEHVGGSDDLYDLEAEGKLDDLLERAS